MKKIILVAVMFVVILCVACGANAGKERAQQSTDTTETIAAEMNAKGFSEGVLKKSSFKECPYILSVSEFKDQLDPINLHDFFKTEIPEKVWVKYASLRRSNRCTAARPVSIIEIQKR